MGHSPNAAVYVNEVAVYKGIADSTGTEYGYERTISVDISSLVHSGTNTLYLYAHDYGVDSGLLFRAEIETYSYGHRTACTNAGSVVSFVPGAGTDHTTADEILGVPDASAVPLGLDGVVTVQLSRSIADGPGPDIVVYENGARNAAIDENYRVEASADGQAYVALGICAGDDREFDIGAVGLNSVRYVRIIDLPPQETGTLPPNLGADMDAVEGLLLRAMQQS